MSYQINRQKETIMNKLLINTLNILNQTVAFVIILAGVISAITMGIGVDTIAQTAREVPMIKDAMPENSLELLAIFSTIKMVATIVLSLVVAAILCGGVATVIDIRNQLVKINTNSVSIARTEPSI